MWNGNSVSLIFPTYHEKDSIYDAVVEAAATGAIDEIIVVSNNAEPGTSEEVTRAIRAIESRKFRCEVREVLEPIQGYGSACMRGLDEAKGDYVCLSEPDGTFTARDVFKLFAYADNYGIVLGSRTVREFIWSGANMWWFLRWGNWAVAKMLEVLFNTNSLTDVGCTMRLLKRSELNQMRKFLTVRGNFFGPQMMVVAALLKLKFVQIPVNYLARVGISSVTGSFWKAVELGFRMIFMILGYRIGKVIYGHAYLEKTLS